VVVVLVAAFMDLLDATIVSVAAPAIHTGLHASGSALQWMVAGYTLALGGGLITGGRIGDQYGRRKIFLIGLTGFILASTLCAVAGSAGVLIAIRRRRGAVRSATRRCPARRVLRPRHSRRLARAGAGAESRLSAGRGQGDLPRHHARRRAAPGCARHPILVWSVSG